MVLADRPTRSVPPVMQPERCCSGSCDYSVDRVGWFLDRLAAYERAGEEPDLRFTRQDLERLGSIPHDGATSTIDIRCVVEQLVAEGQEITAEAVSARLCPWSSTTDACD